MTTTQSQPVPPEKPDAAPGRGAGDFTLLLGLALAPLAFVFGGFAVLLSLPGVFLARLRPAALAYFCGSLLCAVLSMAGVNPWGALVREQALDDLERVLGARPRYGACTFNPAEGTLRFDQLEAELPGLGGSAQLMQATVTAWPGFVPGLSVPRLGGRGLRVHVDGRSNFEAFFAGLDQGPARDLEIELEAIELLVTGPEIEAALLLDGVRGQAGAGSFRVVVSPRRLDLTLWQQTHSLRLQGSASFAREQGQTRAALDLKAADGETAGLYASGVLQPQAGPGGLVVTLDYLDLQQVWARYRKIDVYGGQARGTARISGTLSSLALDLDLSVRDFSYFHRAVMALDEGRAFRIPEARVAGTVRMQDGSRFGLDGLMLSVPEATLCTGPVLQAAGEAYLRLDGEFPRLRGTLAATVTAGSLRQPVSWSPVALAGLSDLQPNLVQVAEQFSDLDLDFGVEVRRLDLFCDPLSGRLAGELTGNLRKQPGSRAATLSVGGRLVLADGRFAFCAAYGDVSGAIEFNPAAPSAEAAVRGTLNGKAGGTELKAEITGRLSHPGLQFSGVTMRPDDLGRLIATHGDADPAEKARRADALNRLCGPAAAMNNNPFLAQKAGRVSFTFKP